MPTNDEDDSLRRQRVDRIRQVKRAARSELESDDEWRQCGYANKFDSTLGSVVDTCERVDARHMSLDGFRRLYERTHTPCVITNAQTNWAADEQWRPDRLVERFQQSRFKVGEDDDGYSVKLSMSDYSQYMQEQSDDSPLYIFDSTYGEHSSKSKLLDDYSIPEWFRDDLFDLADEQRRPPHRWFVMGPARSGTGIHIDPLGTSAWNALVHGYKRWCLFPNAAPKELVETPRQEGGKNRHEAVQWFRAVYPKTKSDRWPDAFKPIEILQKPRETVFIPSGWWHVVINLTTTVAVTQNFASPVNFAVVWHKTMRGRPKLARRWYRRLQRDRPEIADIADTINVRESIAQQSDSSSSCSTSSSSSSSDSESGSCSESSESAVQSRREIEPLSKKRKSAATDSSYGSAKRHAPNDALSGVPLPTRRHTDIDSTS